MKKTLGISKILCSLLLAMTVLIGPVPATNVNAAARSTLNIHYFNEMNYYYWNGRPNGSDKYNVEAIIDCPNWNSISRIDAAVVANNQYVMAPVCKTTFSKNLSDKIWLSENGELNWKFEINKLNVNVDNYLKITISYKNGCQEQLSAKINLKKGWLLNCSETVSIKSEKIVGKFDSPFKIKELHVAIYKGNTLVYINKFDTNSTTVRLSDYKLSVSGFSSGTYKLVVTAVDGCRLYLTNTYNFSRK